jgi:hypothetical protein
MAQLNTTVGNIQLRSRMITTDSPATEWSASNANSTYPSTAAVKKYVSEQISDAPSITGNGAEHILGSVIMTGLNDTKTWPIDPNGKLSGTWELIDWAYATRYLNLADTGAWSSSYADAIGYVVCADHEVHVNLSLTTSTTFSITGDTPIVLGKLNLAKSGMGLASYNPEGLAYINNQNFLLHYYLSNNGDNCEFKVDRLYGSPTSISSGTKIELAINIPMSKDHMIKSFCDKFYWKRIK